MYAYLHIYIYISFFMHDPRRAGRRLWFVSLGGAWLLSWKTSMNISLCKAACSA